jgi:hypothetical protein
MPPVCRVTRCCRPLVDVVSWPCLRRVARQLHRGPLSLHCSEPYSPLQFTPHLRDVDRPCPPPTPHSTFQNRKCCHLPLHVVVPVVQPWSSKRCWDPQIRSHRYRLTTPLRWDLPLLGFLSNQVSPHLSLDSGAAGRLRQPLEPRHRWRTPPRWGLPSSVSPQPATLPDMLPRDHQCFCNRCRDT